MILIPHAYQPDYTDFVDYLVNWLSSPSGNLIWDVGLQMLGIIVTVFFIQRWIEKREERRWLPLKHQMYYRLHNTTEHLVRDLYPHAPHEGCAFIYYFGRLPAISAITKEFGDEILDADEEAFASRALEIIDDEPELLSDFYQEFHAAISRSSVILESKPELSSLVATLDWALAGAVNDIGSRSASEDDEKHEVSGSFLVFYLKWVVREAYKINEWLKSQADAVSDWTELLEEQQESRKRRQPRRRSKEHGKDEGKAEPH